jgi:Fe-S oxidoreductase
VLLLQEYLSEHLDLVSDRARTRALHKNGQVFHLFGHCTERTTEPASQKQWKQVFSALGLEVELKATGCCGMCGTYGHEAEHLHESQGIFEMSWGKQLAATATTPSRVLAAGHSCRSQVKRFAGFVPQHPVEALVEILETKV